ncbi:tRNA 2-thiouridine(34) synthase MnmA [Bacteriovorax sp. Seq25_V]|uniref:tRNA 2-thiouridine(34) synthase MnmA n=1 Tax=Bacteriovorax sp. Seq25_V TaxID=1201288 RepID=UPI00038A2921|nr:tRNA 2-thiouridine(34) synthase MnmA [Bacteriovorax sp. Seq25_V]EQC47688.1 tRNA (5-methylaminomethyl-2-thiouridylate)-methyltransferase [Bacteriovorax sp. Seq25_V]
MTIGNGKTVIVGMSGGVDSSVSALVLKEQGYNVIGMFMKNWEEEDEFGVCQASKEYEDVIKVCEKLDIPYYSVDFVKEYRDNVFANFVEEYKQGFTPNPDILCNREIKFKVFFNKAMELGADYLATGHYCQNINIDGVQNLVKGNDANKDQTYFLYTIKSEILNKVLFPIGDMPKSEVRALAKKYDLATHDKKDSTGICFIGERNFKQFLSNYIQLKPGPFENLAGEVVGEHGGAAYYTNGQRKGLGLGGPGEPWFVVGKDIDRNVVIVERGDNHPALYCDDLTATELSWVDSSLIPVVGQKLYAKVRYRQPDQECTVISIDEKHIKVEFSVPQRAVTKRQSVVFYDKKNGHDICLGGAIIENPGPSYYEMGKDVTNI